MNRFTLLLSALCLGCAMAYTAELSFRFEFGEPGNPQGLALGPDHALFVTDADRNAVFKYDTTGRLLGISGGTGSGTGQFDGPCGITRRSGFDLFVCDARNHRLVRMNERLDILDALPLADTDRNGFFTPLDAAAGSDGTLYICDRGTGGVLALGLDGRAIPFFRGRPQREGMNLRPAALVATAGVLFLYDEGKSRLLRFDRFGTFLGVCAVPLVVPASGLDRMGDTLTAAADIAQKQLILLSPAGKIVYSALFPAPGLFSPGALKVGQGRLYVVNTATRRIVAFRFLYP
ncbi:MAG: hypothetical protein V1913_07930 [Fibrobacterota bacterium]